MEFVGEKKMTNHSFIESFKTTSDPKKTDRHRAVEPEPDDVYLAVNL